ncbi:tyrosine-type recombinase/integrase [Sphingomonas sp. Tas61C01]|uniref:tyrosine-type recombinase/integrase n=1 Tax=Sphingomonas sp. Tas61C01 TaxID=3458297 RepID=UPI00403E768A
MALTATAIKNAKPRQRPYKLSDERGLYLLITPSGGMLWRFKYRADGHDGVGTPKRIEKSLSLGAYPDVTLKDARERRDAARQSLACGIDPARKKREEKQASRANALNAFDGVGEAFIAKCQRDGLADATIRKRRWLLKIVGKSLGGRPIADIKPVEILDAVRPFEAAQNHEKARRTLEFVGAVFRFAVASQLVSHDPTRDLRGVLSARRPRHLSAILEPTKVGELLRAISGYKGHAATQIALSLSPHVFLRPGELRRAEWNELDLVTGIWRIEAGKMKGRKEHVMPLSRQVIQLFRRAEILTGQQRFVFPSVRSSNRPMSENTINGALRRLGFTSEEMTAHGFRATASTLLNESGKWQPDAIERALAHKDRDRVRAAYHRGAHWQERVDMAQWWSDYLDELEAHL